MEMNLVPSALGLEHVTMRYPGGVTAVDDVTLTIAQGEVVALLGPNGAGKTTFSQVLLKELGSQDEVSSPTYSIVNEYDSPKGKIFHFDLYRMNSEEEVFDMGMEEYLDGNNICIIEWPEIYEAELSHLPHHIIEITHAEVGRILNFQ